MPGMDGLTSPTASRGAQGPLRWHAHVILSGYSDFEYAREAISKQVTNYMFKPVSRRSSTPCSARSARSLTSDRALAIEL
jgi:two-component system response regulator YesN